MATQCIVCYEEHILISNSACNHYPRVCKECWIKWTSANENATCPVCFKVIDLQLKGSRAQIRFYLTYMYKYVRLLYPLSGIVIAMYLLYSAGDITLQPIAPSPHIQIISKQWLDMNLGDLKKMYNEIYTLEKYVNDINNADLDLEWAIKTGIYKRSAYNYLEMSMKLVLISVLMLLICLSHLQNYINDIAQFHDIHF